MKTFARLVFLAAAVSPLLAADDATPCSKDQWQCATGGTCIWLEEQCNGKLDCPDGSDETPACVKPGGLCALPPLPEHGTYRADIDGKPGSKHPYFTVNVTCDVGYKLIGEGSIRCLSGWWQQLIPSCIYAGECGVIPANITEQSASKRSQMPWHVDLYDKILNYKHICSGTLIRDDAVITLAFCFLNTYPTTISIPTEETVVVAGNQHQAWNSADESPYLQQSGIKQIHLANYNSTSDESVNLDDLALVILTKPYVYNIYIRPVCINFDVNFDRLQLQPGRKGKFPAWGFSANEVQEFKPTFDVVDFSLVDSDTCIVETREMLRKNNYVLKPEQTICTEYKEGDIFQCLKGYDDTGTGLVYAQAEPEGTQRYYLRGVLWRFGDLLISPNVCKPLEGYALFTRLQNYEKFIKMYFKQPDSVVDERLHSKKCTLPPYPAKGTYTSSKPNARPGDVFDDDVSVNVTCQEGFVVNAPAVVSCTLGEWLSQMPQCVPQCRLVQHPSVEYRCVVSLEVKDGFRACREFEPSDTLVSPVCRTHYYSTSALKFMHCIDGEWYNVPKCTPECGTLTPNGTELVIGGELAQAGEVPWHAGIYSKATRPYKQICGGSLISNKIVISAAHCFWDNLVGKMPASNFAVAVGKLYRYWHSTLDATAQKFNVEAFHLSPLFQGSAANFQDDIALVVLSSPVQYETYVRPVCVDFDTQFEARQLQPGNKGKVAGWGLAAEDDSRGSPVLRVVDLPYVPIQTCIDGSPDSFRAHITSDKICAGYKNESTALCKGDSGGGLAFLELERGTPRYFLRGVASTAPTNDNLCNADTYTTFTRLVPHQDLIQRFWGD